MSIETRWQIVIDIKIDGRDCPKISIKDPHNADLKCSITGDDCNKENCPKELRRIIKKRLFKD